MNPEELYGKLNSAQKLPYGLARNALIQEAIQHADALDHAELQYVARILGITSFGWGGEPIKIFAPFAWCLAAYDRGESDPRFDHELFWSFKTVIYDLTEFPEVPLDKTMSVLDDMERRYRLAGYSMNAVHQHRELLARHIGDRETATEQYRLWCASPRDELSDCHGCEPSDKLDHLVWLGKDEEGIALVSPLLDNELGCSEQPQGILTDLLLPYLRTGRFDEAAQAHRRAYRSLRRGVSNLGRMGTHLIFCGMTGNHARGLEILERHFNWLDEDPLPGNEMYFSASAAYLLNQVVQSENPDVLVRRPAYGDRAAVDWPAAVLRDEFTERAFALAERFDARNGTTEQSKQVQAILSADPVTDYLPLSAPARAAASLIAVAPKFVTYPETPEELATQAEQETQLQNNDTAQSLWARFDELYPEPPIELRARRLVALGREAADADTAVAEKAWHTAVELFDQIGDSANAESTRSRIGLLYCHTDRAEQGLALITTAIEQLSKASNEAALLRAQCRLFVSHQLVGNHEAAATMAAELGHLSESHPDQLLAAELAMEVSYYLMKRGDEENIRKALRLAVRAVEHYRTVPPSTALHRAQAGAASLHCALGELEQGYKLFVDAAQTRILDLRWKVLSTAGKVAFDLGRFVEAQQHLSNAIAGALLFEENEEASALKVDLAVAALNANLPQEAADAAEEVINELDDSKLLTRARFTLAQAHHDLGQSDSALEILNEVHEHLLAENKQYDLAQLFGMRAEILDSLDRDAEAAEYHLSAATAFQQMEEQLPAVHHLRNAALSWQWAGELARAKAVLAEADLLANALPDDKPQVSWQRAVLKYDGARLLAAEGEFEPALERATAAAIAFRNLSQANEAIIADVLRGRLLTELNRTAEAESLLTAALAELPEESPQRPEIQNLLTQIRS